MIFNCFHKLINFYTSKILFWYQSGKIKKNQLSIFVSNISVCTKYRKKIELFGYPINPIFSQIFRLTQGPSIRKMNYYFIFIKFLFWYTTQTKSIQFINKPLFLFWLFPCYCFGFISKAATTKNRQFIYDLSLLWFNLKKIISDPFFI
jgi:hypothetical protein